jgi:hypothetical protein
MLGQSRRTPAALVSHGRFGPSYLPTIAAVIGAAMDNSSIAQPVLDDFGAYATNAHLKKQRSHALVLWLPSLHMCSGFCSKWSTSVVLPSPCTAPSPSSPSQALPIL